MTGALTAGTPEVDAGLYIPAYLVGGSVADDGGLNERGDVIASQEVIAALTASGRGVDRPGESLGQDPLVIHGDFPWPQEVAGMSSFGISSDAVDRSGEGDGSAAERAGLGIVEELQPTLRARANNSVAHGPSFPWLNVSALPASVANGVGGSVAVDAGLGAFPWPQEVADPLTSNEANFRTRNVVPHDFDDADDGADDGAVGGDAPAYAPAYAVALRGREGGSTAELSGEIQPALRTGGGGGDKPHVLVAASQAPFVFDTTQVTHPANYSSPKLGDPSHPLAAAGHPPTLAASVGDRRMVVRRLTPRECERLQGFPDDFSLIPWKNKPAVDCPDGPRYKALGNSMAVPCMRWIGRRIAAHVAALEGNK